jgi:hypothetical protein
VNLTRQAFVLERRINQPNTMIGIALSYSGGVMTTLARDDQRVLLLDGPLEPVPLALYPRWHATGRLLSTHGRPVARIEVDVAVGDDEIGRVQVRPLARHPERWGRRRARSYFARAHEAADETARAIRATAAGLGHDRSEDRRLVGAS